MRRGLPPQLPNRCFPSIVRGIAHGICHAKVNLARGLNRRNNAAVFLASISSGKLEFKLAKYFGHEVNRFTEVEIVGVMDSVVGAKVELV